MFNIKHGNINPCVAKLINFPLPYQGQELCFAYQGKEFLHFQKAFFCQMKGPESKIFQYSSVLTMDMPLDYHTSE